jgi:hypothetical protein
MQYLVDMKLADSARSKVPQEGINLIEGFVLPTLALCKKAQGEGRIVAGGPVGGAVRLALVVEASSIRELDEFVESLPLWAIMETTVTPLTTFDGRAQSLGPTMERLRGLVAQMASGGTRS